MTGGATRGRTRATAAGVSALCLALALGGCAPAMPSFAGGSTTPGSRGDILVGAAYRIPFGELASGSPNLTDAQPGGATPVGAWRWGFAQHYDLGLTVAGMLGRLAVRREVVLNEATTRPVLLFSLGAIGGAVKGTAGGSGARVGGEGSALFAVESGGLYDLWAGLRIGAEHLGGDFAADSGGATQSTDLVGLRAGGVVGLAAGFRRLHALLELGAGWERWSGSQGGASVVRSGLVLTPAFALRLRL